MFDSIYIGTSGLVAYSQGLQVISNNLANVNTTGFKGADLQFTDVFEQNSLDQQTPGAGARALGSGVAVLSTQLRMAAGTDQTTKNPLNVRIDGNGMFALRRGDQTVYSRAGNFSFNDAGLLVNADGDHVLGRAADGTLADITLNGLKDGPGKATGQIAISGNLSSTVAVPAVNATLNNVPIIDAAGTSHAVNLTFKNLGSGSYTVSIADAAAGGAVLGSGTIKFANGLPVPGSSTVSFSYASTGVTAIPVVLDFSNGVTSQTGTSTLQVASNDGYGPGTLSDEAIGTDGVLTVTLSNGQTITGQTIALASFSNQQDLVEISGGAFTNAGAAPTYGSPATGGYGALVAGHLEGSNIDLAQEFSNLILMQRGYQASSHVISTANDMIQELFDMKGNS